MPILKTADKSKKYQTKNYSCSYLFIRAKSYRPQNKCNDMSLIIAAVSEKELATVNLAADHAQDDDISQTRPSHNAAPLRPNQNPLF
jgi:hypothetical protein